MKHLKNLITRTLLSLLLSVGVFASGCSFKTPGTKMVTIALPQSSSQQANFARTKNSSAVVPQSFTDFNCYAVNVYAKDIPTNPLATCTSQNVGIVSDFVQASAGTVSVQVPDGLSRTLQLIAVPGVKNADGTFSCPLISQEFSQPAATAAIDGPVYILGSASTDVESDVSVSLNASFDPKAIFFDSCSSSTPITTQLGWNVSPNPIYTASATVPMDTFSIQLLDRNGSIVTSDNSTVLTLALVPPAGTAMLGGTLRQTAKNGIVSFNDIYFTSVGNFSFSVTDSALNTSLSFSVKVSPAAAPTIGSVAWVVNPPAAYTASSTTAISDFSAQILDGNGSPITSDNSTVLTVYLSTGTGTLEGNTSATVTAGTATFSGLTYTKAEKITLKVKDSNGHRTVASNITVAPSADYQLVFTQQPTDGKIGTALSPAPVVQIQDQYSNPTGNNSATISLSLSSGTLTGTSAIPASSGSSTFTNLVISQAGGPYTLTASATLNGILKTVSSSNFNISMGTSYAFDFALNSTTSSQYTIPNSTDFTLTYLELTPSNQVHDYHQQSFGLSNVGSIDYDSSNEFLRLDPNAPVSDLGLGPEWTPAWNNIVGYWKFEETSGSSFADSSSNHYMDGTAAGSINFVPPSGAVLGNAIEFTGQSSSFLSLSGGTALDFGSANSNGSSFTVAGWIKYSSAYGVEQIIGNGFASGSTNNLAWSSGFSLRINGDTSPEMGRISFGMGDGTGGKSEGQSTYIYTQNKYNDNLWHYVAVVVDNAARTQQIYVDGSAVPIVDLAASCTGGTGVSGPAHTVLNYSSSNNCGYASANPAARAQSVIGGLEPGASTGSTGSALYVDELAVWNTALSGNAIAMIGHRPATTLAGTLVSKPMDAWDPDQNWTSFKWGTTQPFGKRLPDQGSSEGSNDYPDIPTSTIMASNIGLWHFDEASTWTGVTNEILDSSGKGNHGTIASALGGYTCGSGNPYNTTGGRFGNAAVFSGNQYCGISFGATGFPNGTNTALTLSLWFKQSSASSGGTLFGFGDPSSGQRLELQLNSTYQPTLVISSSTSSLDTIVYPEITVKNSWQNIIIVIPSNASSRDIQLYWDGENESNASSSTNPNVALNFGSAATTSVTPILGNSMNGMYPFKGAIDELSVWSRNLNASEIADVYRRGANRISYQLTSCNSLNAAGSCPDGSGWMGPDGTDQTYFSETPSTLGTGPVGVGPASFSGITGITGRYFQYRAILESDSAQLCNYNANGTSSLCSPELLNVAVGPVHYDKNAYVINNATAAPSFTALASLNQPTYTQCSSAPTFQLSSDGSTWYYLSDNGWATTSGGASTSNTQNQLTPTNLSTFPTMGSLYVKTFLPSDGKTACQISDVKFLGFQ